ncbi:MAG: rRNA pseudouridine synthase [Oscillospiraceae bacterium]|nr:rRNA pseudouridine synthase [Oscillospiraceae bacterium]
MQRLDRFLSEAGVESRRKVKDVIRSGRVTVNGAVCTVPEQKIDETSATVTLDGQTVGRGDRRIVVMLHKPAGCVTAATDARYPTVMEQLPPQYRRLMPIGRLDMDTEGLLLFTNDGDLAHRLLSPKKGIEKCYYAEHAGTADAEDVAAFAKGCVLRDGTTCLPAVLEPLGEGKSLVRVREGKYHQVRRMLASRNKPVSYLRRISEGTLALGDLPLGMSRELTNEEIERLESVHFDEKFFNQN